MLHLMTLFTIIFAQTSPQGSTPIWLPILIIIILLLFLWWGLTRNSIPEGEDTAVHDTHAHAEPAHEHHSDASTDHVDEEPEPDPDTRTIPSSNEPDDLKKIEGIGPKISSVLNDAGVTTFAQVAATSVEDLERIVKTEGGVRIAFPASWPEQAALAAAGKWEALEKLQDELVGGRKT